MAKLYSEHSIEKTNNLKPKDETVKFLLDYSKALSVITGKNEKYETFLN